MRCTVEFRDRAPGGVMGQCRQKLNVFTFKIIDIERKMAGRGRRPANRAGAAAPLALP